MWAEDKLYGMGICYFNSRGTVYDGLFFDNKRNGKGTQTWKNGDKYVGYWVNDKMEGTGTLYDKDGKIK